MNTIRKESENGSPEIWANLECLRTISNVSRRLRDVLATADEFIDHCEIVAKPWNGGCELHLKVGVNWKYYAPEYKCLEVMLTMLSETTTAYCHPGTFMTSRIQNKEASEMCFGLIYPITPNGFQTKHYKKDVNGLHDITQTIREYQTYMEAQIDALKTVIKDGKKMLKMVTRQNKAL